MIKNQEDGDLMKLISKKDKNAIQKVVLRFRTHIYLTARKSLKSNQDAEDVSQDVFIKIWKNSSKYDSSKAKLSTWISTITKRTIIDAFRKKVRHKKPLIFDEHEHSPSVISTITETKEEHANALKKIRCLTEKQREVLELVFLEELTPTEISILKNIPEQTVRSLYRRAILNLRSLTK